MITVTLIPILNDNYAYLIETDCGKNAIIDPGVAKPIIDLLEHKNLALDFILNTHHHWDHTNGNDELMHKYNATIAAPNKEANDIKNVTHFLHDKDIFMLGHEELHIIETPGHTRGGICYYAKESHTLFTGDTLFSMGCGRLFEGTAEDMFTSFQKIKSLPDDTLIYCGHEYTKGNAGFCLAQDKNNGALNERIHHVKSLRNQGEPTIPVTLAIEKETNIFMKAKSAEEFATLRFKKDNF